MESEIMNEALYRSTQQISYLDEVAPSRDRISIDSRFI